MTRQHQQADGHFYIKNILIGMTDGLIVPFALTTGLSRTSVSLAMIGNIGLIATVVGALAMGLGGYYTNKSEHDPPSSDGYDDHHSHEEEAKAFYANLGLSEEMQLKAIEEQVGDRKKFEEITGTEEKNDGTHGSVAVGWTIGISYLAGGVIATTPYLLSPGVEVALQYSIGITLSVLLILGFIKYRTNGSTSLLIVLRSAIIGVFAGLGAWLVAGFF